MFLRFACCLIRSVRIQFNTDVGEILCLHIQELIGRLSKKHINLRGAGYQVSRCDQNASKRFGRVGFFYALEVSSREQIQPLFILKSLHFKRFRLQIIQPPTNPKRLTLMLWTIFIILLVLWALGLATGATLNGFIHILLVIAIVVVLLRVIQGRSIA